MSLTTTTNRKTYVGDGSTTTFAYDFKIFQDSDLTVTTYNTTTAAQVTLVLNSDYTVTGAGSALGGDVILSAAQAAALTSSFELIILRAVPQTQETDYVENDPFPADSTETALDKLTAEVQDLSEENNRAITTDISNDAGLTFPALQNGYFLSNDSTDLEWVSSITETQYSGTISNGTDAGKPASPAVGDMYFATDTNLYYKCATAGVWTVDTLVINTLTEKVSLVDDDLFLIEDSADSNARKKVKKSTLVSGITSVPAQPNVKNVVVKNTVATPASQVDIDADNLWVEGYDLTSINLTVDITNSGANGLDTGSEANSTWYYLYAIYDPTGDNTAGLLSVSATSPTLPGDYTKKRLVAAVRNDGGGDFILFKAVSYGYMMENCFEEQVTIKDNSFTASVWTSLSITAYFPSSITKHIKVGFSNNDGLIAVSHRSDGFGGGYIFGTDTGSASDVGSVFPSARDYIGTLDCLYADSIYYFTNATGSTLLAVGYKYEI